MQISTNAINFMSLRIAVKSDIRFYDSVSMKISVHTLTYVST